MKDNYGREIEYMRISITDRCNFRCKYCMPCDVPFIPHEQILSYEEIYQICESALKLGVNRFKITGGEPLVRKGCLDFMRKLKSLPETRQVTITTNGLLLGEYAKEMKEIGIDGINVSLDTLDRDTFCHLTGVDGLERVLDSIYTAYNLGLKVKINCVPLKNVNEKDTFRMLEICKNHSIDVRFIEIMPIGYGKDYAGITLTNLERRIREMYPNGEEVMRKLGNGPARYYHPYEFRGSIGFIDSIHGKFCDKCNRVRITSEGFLKTCLYYNHGVSLRDYIRQGGSQEGLIRLMQETILKKPGEHHFGNCEDAQEDTRKMSQIGG